MLEDTKVTFFILIIILIEINSINYTTQDDKQRGTDL